MTNQEAIIKLTNIMHDDHYAWHPSILTAFGMAVDALKGEGDCISRAEAIDAIESHIRTAEEPYHLSRVEEVMNHVFEIAASCVYNLPSAQPSGPDNLVKDSPSLAKDLVNDCINRQAAIDALVNSVSEIGLHDNSEVARYGATFRQHEIIDIIEGLPSAQPERVWHPVEKPPAHHKDVIVRGVEAIGNVTVHKVMQWDVDTWRPTDYAPSIMWTEWSEI